jgi:hypothetical protein
MNDTHFSVSGTVTENGAALKCLDPIPFSAPPHGPIFPANKFSVRKVENRIGT